jgi:large subunit ribosomal protein L25
MEKVIIKATKREGSRKAAKYLRQDGIIPSVVYGKTFEPVSISVDLRDMTKLLKTVSGSTLFTIDLEGTEILALIREVQRDIIMGYLTHMDFLAVSMDVKVKTSVQVILEGVASAVEDHGAVIITGVSMIDIEALPLDIPQYLVADISTLTEIGKSVAISDLVLPDGVEIFNDPSDMVAIATAPSLIAETQEELEEEEAAAAELLALEGDDDAEPEVIAKGKEEDEEDEE